MGLMQIRSEVSFDVVLKSDEPNFIDLKREGGLKAIAIPVTGITRSFLKSTFPDQVDLSADITMAIVERNPTWSMLDTINFYKTIINRQDLDEFRVFGNKITVLKIMEMCSAYEGLKAEAHERLLAEKGDYDKEYKRRESTDTSLKGLMGKQLEQVYIEAEKNPLKVVKRPPADERYFSQFTDQAE